MSACIKNYLILLKTNKTSSDKNCVVLFVKLCFHKMLKELGNIKLINTFSIGSPAIHLLHLFSVKLCRVDYRQYLEQILILHGRNWIIHTSLKTTCSC